MLLDMLVVYAWIIVLTLMLPIVMYFTLVEGASRQAS